MHSEYLHISLDRYRFITCIGYYLRGCYKFEKFSGERYLLLVQYYGPPSGVHIA